MAAFLPTLVRMSLTGALVILAVLATRLLLRRFPRKYVCLLWLAVLFRLLCPVTLHAPTSAVPEKLESGELVEEWTSSWAEETRVIYADTEGFNEARNAGVPLRWEEAPAREEAPGDGSASESAPVPKYDYYVVTAADGLSQPKTVEETWLPVLAWVWLAGAAGLLAWSALRYLHLRLRLREAVTLEKGVYEAEGLASPFVLGVLRPRIYLPWGMEAQEQSWVLLHERAHIRRLDPLWKLLGWLALCLHWFNPLCWLAFSLAMQDMEGACDEAVVRSLDGEERSAYSSLLLALSAGKPLFAATPLGFGEGNVKQRIRSVLRWRKPRWWMAVLAALLLAAVVLLFALGPRSSPKELQWLETPDLWPRRTFFTGEWTELRAGQRALWPVTDVKGFKKELSAILEESDWKTLPLIDMAGETHLSLFPGTIAWTSDGERWELWIGRSRIYLVRPDAFGYWMGYPVRADGKPDNAPLKRLLALTERGAPALSLTPTADLRLEGLPWGCTMEEALAVLPGASVGDGALTVSGVGFCGFRADAELTFAEDERGAFLNGVTLTFPEEKETFADVDRFDLAALAEELEETWGKRKSGLLYPWWLQDRSKADPDRLLYWLSEDAYDETLRLPGVAAWLDRQLEPRTLRLDASGRNLAAGRQATVEKNMFTEAELFEIASRLAPDGAVAYDGARMAIRVTDRAVKARLQESLRPIPWVGVELVDAIESSEPVRLPDHKPEEGWELLTDEEVYAAAVELEPVRRGEDGITWVNPADPCFTSYYKDPRELNFTDFMRYFSDPSITAATEDDLRAVVEAGYLTVSPWRHLEDLSVPMHRIPAAAVEAALRRFFDIGFNDLNSDYRTRCYYLPETDSFYSFTSDFGPGVFQPEWGEKKDDTVRLWSGRTCLTCRKLEDRWIILSFWNEEAGGKQAREDPETRPAAERYIDPEYPWVFVPEELNYKSMTEGDDTVFTIPAGYRYRVEWVQITQEREIVLRAELETMVDSKVQLIILRAEDVIPWTEELADRTVCPVYLPAGTTCYPRTFGNGDEAKATLKECLTEDNAQTCGNDMAGVIQAAEDGYALMGFAGGMEVWVKHEEVKVGTPTEAATVNEHSRMLAAGRIKALELGYPLETWGAELVWHFGREYAAESEHYSAYYPTTSGEGTVCVVFSGSFDEGFAPDRALLIPPGAEDWP